MFKLPWKVHGVGKGPPHNLLVQIEHTHLLELYQHALVEVDRLLHDMPVPKFTTSSNYYTHQSLKHDKRHYEEMIEWLRDLKP